MTCKSTPVMCVIHLQILIGKKTVSDIPEILIVFHMKSKAKRNGAKMRRPFRQLRIYVEQFTLLCKLD